MPKLTQAALRRLIKKTGRHSDGGGLYFRVIGEGKAYFVYRYRVDGREREKSLGPYPELSLAEAREKHAALRKSVVVDRADPLAEKHAAARRCAGRDQGRPNSAASWCRSLDPDTQDALLLARRKGIAT